MNYLAQFDSLNAYATNTTRKRLLPFQGILEEGIEKGVFNIEDPFLASIAIVTSMKGFEIPLYIKERRDKTLSSVWISFKNVI